MDFRDIDLISLVEKDLGPGKKSGRWVVYRCPFHSPDRHPSFAVTNGDGDQLGPGWRCFSAACGKHGGPLTWLMEYRHLEKGEAMSVLSNGSNNYSGNADVTAGLDWRPEYPPGEKWQERAHQLVEGAEQALWSCGSEEILDWPDINPKTGEETSLRLSPLDWLLARGLSEKTIKFWRLGYIPKSWREKPENFGFGGEPVAVSQGILIPCFVGREIWYLKIRRPAAKPNKYIQIRGSKPGLFMIQTLDLQDTVVICEGELDSLLLWQEAGEKIAVVTLGSCSASFNVATWGLHFIYARRRFIAYDTDKAGEAGSEKIGLGVLHPMVLKVPKINPFDKDMTDYYRSGGDLTGWLLEEGVIKCP